VPKSARLFVVVAALLMSVGYVLPLWRVNLVAPQYPEGLGMLIKVNTVVGVKEQDLNSINNLNHYIGMKRIEPDAIPELRYMPTILGVLIGTALLVAAIGRRRVLYGWSVALMAVLGTGLYDYWRWGYDYGHNLEYDTAIIKIPGMTYQPPLIGTKQLLNFTATSWPAPGGWAMVLATVLVGIAVWRSSRPAVSVTGAIT
jgi:copper chaperone NosL